MLFVCNILPQVVQMAIHSKKTNNFAPPVWTCAQDYKTFSVQYLENQGYSPTLKVTNTSTFQIPDGKSFIITLATVLRHITKKREKNPAPGRNRTRNLSIHCPMCYHLSYHYSPSQTPGYDAGNRTILATKCLVR